MWAEEGEELKLPVSDDTRVACVHVLNVTF